MVSATRVGAAPRERSDQGEDLLDEQRSDRHEERDDHKSDPGVDGERRHAALSSAGGQPVHRRLDGEGHEEAAEQGDEELYSWSSAHHARRTTTTTPTIHQV